jgi:hypothetical protein
VAATRSAVIAGAAEIAGMLVVELELPRRLATRSAAIAGAAELPPCSWSSSNAAAGRPVGGERLVELGGHQGAGDRPARPSSPACC